MYNRLSDFIEQHDLLYKYQFVFRKGHNTNMSHLVLIYTFTGALQNGNMVLGIFLDLRKLSILLITRSAIRKTC